jgi:hypothetical protein
MKLEFSRQSFEKYSKLVKNRPVGEKFFHADGQTDRTKLIIAFRNFANSRKNVPVKRYKISLLNEPTSEGQQTALSCYSERSLHAAGVMLIQRRSHVE